MLARKFFWVPKLPAVSGEDVINVLSKQWFTVRKVKEITRYYNAMTITETS